MKIVIDECLPRRMKKGLIGHQVFTVQEMGWASQKNGELLRLMSGQTDVFVTVDKNMEYQQKLTGLTFSVIVLNVLRNTMAFIDPLMPDILTELESIQPGDVVRIPNKTIKESQ